MCNMFPVKVQLPLLKGACKYVRDENSSSEADVHRTQFSLVASNSLVWHEIRWSNKMSKSHRRDRIDSAVPIINMVLADSYRKTIYLTSNIFFLFIDSGEVMFRVTVRIGIGHLALAFILRMYHCS